MARLSNRNVQIPFGLKFYQPETRFNSRQGSFNNVVDQVVAMRKANPALVAKHNWSVEWEIVADEVDAFNSAICERMGWTNFINQPGAGVAPSPKFKALSPMSESQLAVAAGRVKKIWSGVKTTQDWKEAGYPTVEQTKAEGRAKRCVECPMNGKGDFTRWFTTPAAEAIKRQVEAFNAKKLSTPSDEKLGVCEGCLCPLRTKVFCPIEFVRPHTSQDTLHELMKGNNCWVVEELNQPI